MAVEFASVAGDAPDVARNEGDGVGDIRSDGVEADGDQGGKRQESPSSGDCVDRAGEKSRDGKDDDAAGAQMIHGGRSYGGVGERAVIWWSHKGE